MKCNDCWRKASISMKFFLYGKTFYKYLCNYHFIKEGLSLLNIKEKLKEKLGGDNNATNK